MKRFLLLVVMSSLLAVVGGTARAQVVDPIVADIPFDFIVRGTTLPAGHYTVKRFGSNPEVMEVLGDDNHRTPVLFMVESAQVSKEPHRSELIFNRVGDQYFLSEVFEAGDRTGVEVPRSRTERRLEKEGVMIHITVPGLNALGGKSGGS